MVDRRLLPKDTYRRVVLSKFASKTLNMKCSTLLSLVTSTALVGLTPFANAQFDMSAAMANRSGVNVVPDTDPFSPNSFVGSFTMEMHTYANGNENSSSPVNMDMHSSAEKIAVLMNMPGVKEKVRTIIDNKEKWQYMLMPDGKGSNIAVKTRKMKVLSTEDGTVNATDVLVTEETKTIDGRVCKKLIAKTEDGTWTGWMAEGMEVPFHSFMRDLQRTGPSMHSAALNGISGFPLEYEFVSKDGKERIQCFIRDLKVGTVDEKEFSLEGYQVLELPVVPAGR